MKVGFTFNEKSARKPIIFETIFAEKNGGGLVANCPFDLVRGLAMGLDSDGKFAPVKGAFIVEDASDDATTLKIAKGSGFAQGDAVAFAKKSVAITAIDTTTSDDFDTITIATLGVALKKGDVLYQSKAVSASAAVPFVEPLYILGEDIPANSGDVLAKLVNGANIRKETAPVADAVVALMKSIAKI